MQEIRISEEFLVKNSGTNQRKLIDEEIIRQKDVLRKEINKGSDNSGTQKS
jgi:hypothetical protein